MVTSFLNYFLDLTLFYHITNLTTYPSTIAFARIRTYSTLHCAVPSNNLRFTALTILHSANLSPHSLPHFDLLPGFNLDNKTV